MRALGPEYATLDVCRHDFRPAREFGLLSSAHVSGRSNRVVPDGYRTIAAEGLLGPDDNIVHGNYLEDDELDLSWIRASRSVRPGRGLRLHAREPLSGRVRRRGGTPSIGVDCPAFACDRMLDALRFAMQSLRMFDNRAAAGEQADGPLPPSGKMREAITWAQSVARALRLDHRIGSLRPGKQADIIVVRPQTMTIAPARDPVQALLNFAQTPTSRRCWSVGIS